jgi:hypothetical protein
LDRGPRAHELIDRAANARHVDDGIDLLWPTGEQLWLAAPVHRATTVVALLQLVGAHARRAAATDRVWRRLSGLKPLALRSPPAQTRRQLLLKLRALTGRQAGASNREIAVALFGRDRVPNGAAWKTSDLRSRTLRLVGEGRRLMNGGYLGLLA